MENRPGSVWRAVNPFILEGKHWEQKIAQVVTGVGLIGVSLLVVPMLLLDANATVCLAGILPDFLLLTLGARYVYAAIGGYSQLG